MQPDPRAHRAVPAADADQLAAVAARLWPDAEAQVLPRRLGPVRPAPRDTRWLVLPRAARPRMLVPETLPGGWRMLRRSDPGARWPVLQRALSVGVRSSLLRRLVPADRLVVPGAGGVETQLSEVLGQPVGIGVRLGRPRAHRAVVLQVFDVQGHTIAFAKLGSSGTSDQGLEQEAAALRRVHRLSVPGVGAPALLHAGRWNDHVMLVMSALQGRTPSRGEVPLEAMSRLSCAEEPVTQPLGGSDFLARVSRELDQIADAGVRAEVTAALEGLGPAADHTLTYGYWHGDWAPWNMVEDDGRVLLWDWEHFEDRMPLGFDALHFTAQRRRQQGLKDLPAAEQRWLDDAGRVLASVGVTGAAATVTTWAYLLRINVRYSREAEDDPDRPTRRNGWGLPLLAHVSALLTDSTPGGMRV